MAQFILWLAAVFLIASASYLIKRDWHETQVEQLRLKKMRGEEMYRQIYEILQYARKRKLEKMVISENQITFFYFQPEKTERQFVFAHKGFKYLNQTRLHTLALLIETDHAVLKDKKKYHFMRRTITKPNGTKTFVYIYVIKSSYKDAINRAPYYSGNAHEGLILRRN